MPETAPRPLTVNIALALILLAATLWLVFGALLLMNAHPGFPDDPLVRGGMALLSVLVAALLLVLLSFVLRRRRVAYAITLGVLSASALAIFLDDVGLADLVVLALNAIPLALLIKDRAWYTVA